MKAKEELKELKLKSVSDLQRMLSSDREKLRDLRFKVSQNQLKNIREIRQLRIKISRIITLINQKVKSIKASEPVKASESKDVEKNIKKK